MTDPGRASGDERDTYTTDPVDPDRQPPPDALRHSRGETIAAAVGGFMGSIEQQVFRRQPPAVEQVRDATPVRGTTGVGLEITVELPGPDR